MNRVLAIQSHVVSGYVGNKCATFPLQLSGFDVDPIMSVQFSNHTGYPKFKGTVMDGQQLDSIVEGLEDNGLLQHSHMLTGYIGSVSFLQRVIAVLDRLQRCNPRAIYVCDPVLGDEGRLYVPEELVSVYRSTVVPRAHILTPNQFELERLTGIEIHSMTDVLKGCEHLHAQGVRTVVVTSTAVSEDDVITVVGSTKDGQGPAQFEIVVPRLHGRFTGTGDLMSALLLANLARDTCRVAVAVERTVASVQAVLRNTVEYADSTADSNANDAESIRHRELRLVQSRQDLTSPEARATETSRPQAETSEEVKRFL